MDDYDLFDKTVDYIRSLPNPVQFDALYLIGGNTDEFDYGCAEESIEKYYNQINVPLWLEYLARKDKDAAMFFLKKAILAHVIPNLIKKSG